MDRLSMMFQESPVKMVPRIVRRMKIKAEDVLRFNPAVRRVLALSMLYRAPRQPAGTTPEAVQIIVKLCQAARLASSERLLAQVENKIGRQLPAIKPNEIPWGDFLPDFGDSQIAKAIVLKRYINEREKGVVFVSFDNQMAKLARSSDLDEFAKRYTLVLSPQWSPPHSASLYLFPMLYPDSIFCLISNTQDLRLIPRISRKYKMVPLYASSWVDPREHTPVAAVDKNIDIFMLANFAKYKRHNALFEALRHMPREFRVVLIGQRERGRTRETLLKEAAVYGVRDSFEIRENVSDSELHDTFVRARTSLILSRREGSCVAVVESLFANTPVGLYEDAEVGSKAFINEHTGRLLQHRNLGPQLVDFVRCSTQYEPRRWAMENHIDCRSSSKILNDALKHQALCDGNDWTEDIAELRWRPNPQYYDHSVAEDFRLSYEDIGRRCGIEIGPPR
jgi:glycosyltransferase involved in cell wall biosynthesis